MLPIIISVLNLVFVLIAVFFQIVVFMKKKKTRGIFFLFPLIFYLVHSTETIKDSFYFYPETTMCFEFWEQNCFEIMIPILSNFFCSVLFLIYYACFVIYTEKERRGKLRLIGISSSKEISPIFSHIFLFLVILFSNIGLTILFLIKKDIFLIEFCSAVINILISIQGLPQLCYSLYYKISENTSIISHLFLFLGFASNCFYHVMITDYEWYFYSIGGFIQLLSLGVSIGMSYKKVDVETEFYVYTNYNE